MEKFNVGDRVRHLVSSHPKGYWDGVVVGPSPYQEGRILVRFENGRHASVDPDKCELIVEGVA